MKRFVKKLHFVNRIPFQKFSENLSAIIFIALFPVFFFYHFALAMGEIPPFLGGWYGITSLLSLILILPLGIIKFLHERGLSLQLGVLFSLLILYVGSLAGVYFFLGSGGKESFTAFEHSGSFIVFSTVLFLVGYFLKKKLWFSSLLWISLGIMLLIVFLNIDPSLMMFYAKRQFAVSQGVASYQGFARSLVVVAIMLLAFSKSKLLQASIFTFGVTSLYFIGARSEFYGFIVLGALWIGILILKGEIPREVKFVGSLIFILLIVLLFIEMPNNRQLEVFNLASSSSWQKRIDLLKEGWKSITSSPIIGDYAGQMEEAGFGSYIHNGLSSWRQFGIFGFFLYFLISLVSFFIPCKVILIDSNLDEKWVAAFLTNFFSLVLLIAAKSIYWALPALAWGLTTGSLSKTQVNLRF